MKVIGLADGHLFHDEMWLLEYDIDVPPQRAASYFTFDRVAVIYGRFGGIIKLTPRRPNALPFTSIAEAMATWNTVSKLHPRRPDGRPNKPLTALTVEIEPEKEQRGKV
jgi:hypothetical protein